MINELFEIIRQRQDNPQPGSYTNRLLEQGTDAVLQKVGEEAIEVILAAKGQGRQRLIEESADLLYHTLVLLAQQGVALREVEDELRSRHAAEKSGVKTHIALFDMDGVLLESRGYHIALQETVQWLALDLGFPNLRLSAADIAAFEAGGISSEWDEAAICHAVMLRQRAGLDTPASFAAAAARLAEPDLLPLHPLQRAEKLLVELPPQAPLPLAEELRQVLRRARDIHASPSQRLFQELVLGSPAYARAYGLPPQRQSDSYLRLYDQPLLTAPARAALRAWLAQPGYSGAILTARPNQPPPGAFGTPEAEIGAALVGLESLPISGWGGLCCLAEPRQLDPQELIKPHAVHALAALQLALGAPYSQALASAMHLGWDGQLSPAWATLDGAEVSVFEDTRGGLLSLAAAQQTLARHGIQFQSRLYGIAARPVKVAALQAAGAAVYPDLSAAFRAAGIQRE